MFDPFEPPIGGTGYPLSLLSGLLRSPEVPFPCRPISGVMPAEWVESRGVNPRSARCSRTSPTTGMRLRAANRVPAGGRFPVDVYRVSGMCWHTSPTPSGDGFRCGGILGSITFLILTLLNIAMGCLIFGISSSVLRTFIENNKSTLRIP